MITFLEATRYPKRVIENDKTHLHPRLEAIKRIQPAQRPARDNEPQLDESKNRD